MGDGDSRYVSKPPVKADLNVLCVDGTRPTDSAAFFAPHATEILLMGLFAPVFA